MTLQNAKAGETYHLDRVEGTQKTIDYLQTLGFFSGSSLTLITKTKTSFIISVKDGRYAIDRKLAGQILVFDHIPKKEAEAVCVSP